MPQSIPTLAPTATALIPFMRPETGLSPDQIFGFTTAPQLVAAFESGGGGVVTPPDTGGGGTVSDGYVVDCTPAGGDNAAAGGAWATALASAVTLGRKVRLKAGNHSFATGFTFTTDVVFERGAVITHYVTTTSGTDPSDSATVSFQGDVIADRTQRIFNFREVPESVNICPVSFAKPLIAYYEWYDDGAKYPATGLGGDWSFAIQMAIDSFRTAGVGGVVAPGRPGTLYMLRWPVYVVGKYSSELTWNLGHSRHISYMNQGTTGYGIAFNIGNSVLGTSGATKKHRIAGATNAVQQVESANSGWVATDGVDYTNGLGGPDTGPPGRNTDGTVGDWNAVATYAYPTADWAGCSATNCRIEGPGSLEYLSAANQTAGYNIQFSNARSCHANNIWCRNGLQMFGFGSDEYQHEISQWAAPYCYDCHVSNLWSDRVRQGEIYYSLGFFGFCRDCTSFMTHTISAPGTTNNGNGIGFNYAYNCHARYFTCYGNTANSNSAGVEFIFASRRCKAMFGHVYNYKHGISHYALGPGGGQGAGDHNAAAYVVCENCTDMIYLAGHYCYFIFISNVNCTWDLNNQGNVNGNNTMFVGTPVLRITGLPSPGGGQPDWTFSDDLRLYNTSRERKTVTGAPAAGTANVCSFSGSVRYGGTGNNGLGNITIQEVQTVKVWVSADRTTGAGILSTAPSTGLAIGASGVIINTSTAFPTRFIEVQTNSSGTFAVTYTDTAKTAGYMWVEVNGETSLLGALVYG